MPNDLVLSLDSYTYVREWDLVNGSEFIRKIDKLAKARNLVVHWDPSHGKGSHGRLGLGEKSTTLKDLKKEIGRGLLSQMCKQLGITPEDIRNA